MAPSQLVVLADQFLSPIRISYPDRIQNRMVFFLRLLKAMLISHAEKMSANAIPVT